MRGSNLLKMMCIMFMFCVITAFASLAQTFTTLDSLDSKHGAFPSAALSQAADGNLYGTAPAGGVYDYGTVFKITVAGRLTTLQSFDGTDGSSYATLIQGSDGNFYGTTAAGGTTNNGTVFKITAAGTLMTLYSFCSQTNCTDGTDPSGLVQATNGSFYGTTIGGGGHGNYGTVFKITPGGRLTTLYSFCAQANCTDGTYPSLGLIQATDGNFYGTTSEGGGNGVHGYGTIFKITAAGTLTTLHTFCAQANCTDGRYPTGLMQATDENLYGTTEDGANAYSGTVFQLNRAGTLTTLYTFCAQANCADGSYPTGLVQASDGNFYGTTQYAGANNNAGTVFQFTPAGTLTTLYNFCSQTNDKGYCGDGRNPSAGLVQDTNGTFYGTTQGGGYSNGGTVFSLSVGLGPFVKTYPTSGKVGAKVIILGNNVKGTISVTFNGTTAPLLKVTASAIETSVPIGATTGPVVVTTPSGTLNSNVAFRVLP
jgi:uncharacterized repeat protein (TIGR03803 family)